MNLEAFADMVCETLNLSNNGTGRPDMCTDIGKPWLHLKHAGWLLTSDQTIRGQTDTRFPIEIVSPILDFQPSSTWRTEIRDLFTSISKLYDFHTDPSCGLHVHLSPGSPGSERGDWTLDELKHMAQAAVYFEDALEVLTSEPRRVSSSSNRWEHRPDRLLQGLGTKHQCLQRVREAGDARALCALVHQDKNSSWDFTNACRPSGTGTVKFRRPPGVTDAEGCLAWAEMAVGFVQSARRPEFCAAGVEGYSQTVEGLERFCYDGIMEGVSNKKYLEPLFEGKG